jgi:hypothetical protein
MKETITRLLGVSLALILFGAASYYLGPRYALGQAPAVETVDCDLCFAVGDEWKILAGFLVVLAAAFAFAAVLMWLRERRERSPTVSIIS